MLRAGDKVIAKPNTLAEFWSEGQTGTILGVRDHKPYSGNGSNNLVRWGEEGSRLGFRHNEVIKIEESE